MKAKKFHKKLMLNKKTIADLGGNEMSGLKGGKILPTEPTWVTCRWACPSKFPSDCVTYACGGFSCPCGTGQDDNPMI